MDIGRGCWDLARDCRISEEEFQALRAERDALYEEFLRSKPFEIERVLVTAWQLLTPRGTVTSRSVTKAATFDLLPELLHRFIRLFVTSYRYFEG